MKVHHKNKESTHMSNDKVIIPDMPDGYVYIAGPMRGYKLFNFPAFDEASEILKKWGWDVVSPADMDRENGFDPKGYLANFVKTKLDPSWSGKFLRKGFVRDCIQQDVDAVMSDELGAVVALPGWEYSTGARAEIHLAWWRGVPVYEWPTMEALDGKGFFLCRSAGL